MTRPLLFAFLAICFTQHASAQIYADVTVSQGETELGTFRIQLYHDLAPRTVANFIGLATGERNWIHPETGALQVDTPYYDGLIFHRLIHDFVIQGGDPLGTGTGGPGYVFQDEFHSSLSHVDYAVSMANSGAFSNGSQFFINLSAPTFLDNKHSVFGLVIDDATYPNSRSLIDGFKNSTNFPTNVSDGPTTPITIDSISVSGPDLAGFDIDATSHQLPVVAPEVIEIDHDSGTGDFTLNWDAARMFDYPVSYSADLVNWTLNGKVLTMSDIPSLSYNVTSLATGSKTFFRAAQVDYSAIPEAPQNLLASGLVLEFDSNGGILRITPNGLGAGTWRFIYDDGTTPDDSGSITSSSLTDTSSFPIIPTSGAFLNETGSTYARYIAARQITVFLDGEAGPDLITAIQPTLSFHQTVSGWFDGGVNSNSSGAVTFRGEFTISGL